MTRATALVFILNLIVGWFASALFAGGALAPALVLAFLIAAAIWILRVAGRADVVYAALGLALGVILPLLLPQLSLDNIGADALVQTFGLFVFVLQS